MQTVYRLIDPRDRTVHYIGVSSNPLARYGQHLTCDGSNPNKDTWIKEVYSSGSQVVFEVVERVDTAKEGKKREAYWINHYLCRGAPLANIHKPRDREHYQYYNVSIPCQSSILRYVDQIHRKTGVSEEQILVHLASEYVRLRSEGKCL